MARDANGNGDLVPGGCASGSDCVAQPRLVGTCDPQDGGDLLKVVGALDVGLLGSSWLASWLNRLAADKISSSLWRIKSNPNGAYGLTRAHIRGRDT